MFDTLGSMLQPDPVTSQKPLDTTQQADLTTQWKGWLDNPANRAGLMSFGLSLMVGGWGNGASQLGTAIGNGLDSAAATSKTIYDEEQKQARIAEAKSEKADNKAWEKEKLNRELSSRERIANIMASSRMDVAQLRASGSGGMNKAEQTAWQRGWDSVDKDINAVALPEEEKQMLRQSRADAAVAAHRQQFGAGNFGVRQNGATDNSGNMENGAAPAQSPPPTTAPKSNSENATNSGKGYKQTTVDEALADPRIGPMLREAAKAGKLQNYSKYFTDPQNLNKIK